LDDIKEASSTLFKDIEIGSIFGDLKDPASKPTGGIEFTLRDYATTGDAVRIAIPSANGQTQHL
jgi:hypothetical protein